MVFGIFVGVKSRHLNRASLFLSDHITACSLFLSLIFQADFFSSPGVLFDVSFYHQCVSLSVPGPPSFFCSSSEEHDLPIVFLSASFPFSHPVIYPPLPKRPSSSSALHLTEAHPGSLPLSPFCRPRFCLLHATAPYLPAPLGVALFPTFPFSFPIRAIEYILPPPPFFPLLQLPISSGNLYPGPFLTRIFIRARVKEHVVSFRHLSLRRTPSRRFLPWNTVCLSLALELRFVVNFRR